MQKRSRGRRRKLDYLISLVNFVGVLGGVELNRTEAAVDVVAVGVYVIVCCSQKRRTQLK